MEPVRDILPVIDVRRAEVTRRFLRVADEPRRSILERARLPRVVGRLAADDDVCPLGLQRFARLFHVVHEGVDDLSCGRRDARLIAVSEAIGTPVVGGTERPAVVMPELDDDEVAGVDDIDDGLKPSFVCE